MTNSNSKKTQLTFHNPAKTHLEIEKENPSGLNIHIKGYGKFYLEGSTSLSGKTTYYRGDVEREVAEKMGLNLSKRNEPTLTVQGGQLRLENGKFRGHYVVIDPNDVTIL